MKDKSIGKIRREVTDIFDRSIMMGDPKQRNATDVRPTELGKTGDYNKPTSYKKPTTTPADGQRKLGFSTSPNSPGSATKSPLKSSENKSKGPLNSAKSTFQDDEETIFTSFTGKKKTRKLPNLGDFGKKGAVDTDKLDDDLIGDSGAQDLTTDDLTEIEKAEKLLEESYASGKTKKILPEKEGETVRQELVIDGDKPGEKKTIIQEITKRRVSNPGKLPKELLAQMDKKGGVYTIYETRTKMTTTRLHGHETSDFADMNEEDLLTQLTQQELDELANDVDPDDPLLPPSERCKILTKKDPTGPLNRRNLLKYLERQSINQDDWEETVPFTKEVRGTIWKAKDMPQQEEFRISIDLPEEYEKALNEASESDLVDIAGILDLHSLVNQTQYNSSLKALSTEKGGFKAIARGDKLKVLPPEPPNTTDPKQSLEQLEKNDSSLKKLILNNIRDISPAMYLNIARSLKQNNHIENIGLANTRVTDTLAKVLADSIRDNKSIKSLNLESNALSPEAVVYVFGAVCDNPNIIEFKAANQRNTFLGNRAEMELATLMASNHHLLRLGLTLNVPEARTKIAGYLKRNLDELRVRRLQHMNH